MQRCGNPPGSNQLTGSPSSRPRVFYGWWVLSVTALAVFFSAGSSHWTLTVLIDPMTEAFESSHAELLGVLAVAGISGSVLAPVLGRCVDRFGARIVATSGLLVYGLMLILLSQVQALWQFYILYGTGLGITQAALWRTGAPAVAANWFLRRRGVAFATLSVAAAVSGILFPIATQAITDWQDWRTVWLIIGIAIVAIPTPLAWLVIRRRPEDIGLSPDGDASRSLTQTKEDLAAGGGRRGEVADVSWTLREAVRSRTFWVLNGGLFLIAFPSFAMLAVMHPYFTGLGFESATASRLVSTFGIGVLIGALGWGVLVQLSSVRVLLVPFAVFYGGTIILLIALGDANVAILYFAILVQGIAIIGEPQLGNQIWADYYGRTSLGSIIGVSTVLRTIPLAVAPLLAAAIRDAWGTYAYAFALYAGLCFLGALMLLFAKPPKKRTSVPTINP